jgi:hypothetical protein
VCELYALWAGIATYIVEGQERNGVSAGILAFVAMGLAGLAGYPLSGWGRIDTAGPPSPWWRW